MPTSTARRTRSSSRSISSSPKVGADPVGPLEAGQHEDVEQLGAGSRPEGVQAIPQSALKLVGTHVTGD
jgi:hypothetical protein